MNNPCSELTTLIGSRITKIGKEVIICDVLKLWEDAQGHQFVIARTLGIRTAPNYQTLIG